MIIGITGTNGSGKGAVGEYLVARHGFSRYTARTVILDELRARHLPLNRENMREVANSLRKEHGAAYVIERLYDMAKGETNVVMESVRTIGEAEFLKSKGAVIIAVDAECKIRYERVANKETDEKTVTYEDFCLVEDREMASSDPWDMNVYGVMQLADERINNNGTLSDLMMEVDQALMTLKSKKPA
ncbi:MAG: dephospho-CoA kinase [Parcubacteria bacterium C7867-004]|nr:MAG: dephospho-CoA kinase [Parcubacteria bacterium C7867-004]